MHGDEDGNPIDTSSTIIGESTISWDIITETA